VPSSQRNIRPASWHKHAGLYSFVTMAHQCRNVLGVLESIHIIRHDTTKITVRSYLSSVNRYDMQWQAKYSLLSIPTTLSLSLAVSDGLVCNRTCENRKIIFCRIVWCCVVSCHIMWIDPSTYFRMYYMKCTGRLMYYKCMHGMKNIKKDFGVFRSYLKQADEN
jgi:hypothetical protein